MLNSQRNLFQIPDDVHYLNCAYMSPQLKGVEVSGKLALRRKNEPWTVSTDDFFEPVQRVKTEFARLINCNDPHRIAIIPSASYGLANAASNVCLEKGQQILVVDEQFPSNYYIWERVARRDGAEIVTVGPKDSGNRTTSWNERILEAITPRTAVVAAAHVHWADGTLFDLEAIRKACDTVGAKLIIDGTQSVGALPFDVEKTRPDALVCAAYKWLMGPYSIGLAYYGPYFDQGIPIEENWINRKDSGNFAGLVDYQPEYQPGAARFSVGEHSNFLLIPMLETALKQINAWSPDRIQIYAEGLGHPAFLALREMGCLLEPLDQRAHHLVGVRLPAHMNLDKLKQELLREKVMVSFRGNAIRISTHVYNQEQDFAALLKCFRYVHTS